MSGTTVLLFRKMSVAEAEKTLATFSAQPAIKGTHSIKHFSSSLEKVRAFHNKAVTAPETIMQTKYSRNEVYPYLIQSLHSSKIAEDFFRGRLDDEQLLAALITLACQDESDDARMEAAFWASQFSSTALARHQIALKQLSQDGWESVAVHAQAALSKIVEAGRPEMAP